MRNVKLTSLTPLNENKALAKKIDKHIDRKDKQNIKKQVDKIIKQIKSRDKDHQDPELYPEKDYDAYRRELGSMALVHGFRER